MKFYIKNMVCIRCKMIVKSELEKLGLHYITVEYGEVDIMEDISTEQLEQLGLALKKTGLTPSHFKSLKIKRQNTLENV